MLREAVCARRTERLSEARTKGAAAGVPPLTMEEINAEIKADRAERRAASIDAGSNPTKPHPIRVTNLGWPVQSRATPI